MNVTENKATTRGYPPIKPGTIVKTTEANPEITDWGAGAFPRRWGVRGIVEGHHDSHGLCYRVSHEDGSVGCYDPSELEIVETDGT